MTERKVRKPGRMPNGRPNAGKPAAKTYCEFFAGIGLVRAGLEHSGWQCVYANDIDPKKQQGYEARYGISDHFHREDIGQTEKIITRIQGAPFLATASFPCIDVSLAGHYKGFAGKHSSTFFGFIKVLRALQERKPKVVMLENVTGFLSSRGGQDFREATLALAEQGYWLDAFIVDACHFTPQSRPRVFVVGVLDGIKRSLPPSSSGNGWLWEPIEAGPLRPESVLRHRTQLHLPTGWLRLELPEPPRRKRTLEEVIDLDDQQDWWNAEEVEKHYRMMHERHRCQVDELLFLKKRWVGTIFRRTRAEQMRAEVRFDGLAGCLRTPKGGSAKQIVIATDQGKLRMRWMSPREYARLQGAEDFPLIGSPIQQLWAFADAVCVPAIAWIDQCVLTPLFKRSTAHSFAEKTLDPTH